MLRRIREQQKGLVREEKLSYHASRLKASPPMPDHCRKIFVWEFFNEFKEVGRVYSWLGDDASQPPVVLREPGRRCRQRCPPSNRVSNADGTKLKASAPQPMSPRSIRVSNLTPQLVLQNADTAGLSYVFEVLDASSSQVLAKSDPIPAGSPQTTWDVPANVLKMNATYAWRAIRGVLERAGVDL